MKFCVDSQNERSFSEISVKINKTCIIMILYYDHVSIWWLKWQSQTKNEMDGETDRRTKTSSSHLDCAISLHSVSLATKYRKTDGISLANRIANSEYAVCYQKHSPLTKNGNEKKIFNQGLISGTIYYRSWK